MAALPAARLAKLIKAAVKDEYGIYFQKGNKIEVSIKVPKFNKDFVGKNSLRKTISLKTKDKEGLAQAMKEARALVPQFKKQAFTDAKGIEYKPLTQELFENLLTTNPKYKAVMDSAGVGKSNYRLQISKLLAEDNYVTDKEFTKFTLPRIRDRGGFKIQEAPSSVAKYFNNMGMKGSTPKSDKQKLDIIKKSPGGKLWVAQWLRGEHGKVVGFAPNSQDAKDALKYKFQYVDRVNKNKTTIDPKMSRERLSTLLERGDVNAHGRLWSSMLHSANAKYSDRIQIVPGTEKLGEINTKLYDKLSNRPDYPITYDNLKDFMNDPSTKSLLADKAEAALELGPGSYERAIGTYKLIDEIKKAKINYTTAGGQARQGSLAEWATGKYFLDKKDAAAEIGRRTMFLSDFQAEHFLGVGNSPYRTIVSTRYANDQIERILKRGDTVYKNVLEDTGNMQAAIQEAKNTVLRNFLENPKMVGIKRNIKFGNEQWDFEWGTRVRDLLKGLQNQYAIDYGVKVGKPLMGLAKRLPSNPKIVELADLIKQPLNEGGRVGIQPVESPTQKFDIQVKEMMETTGLDLGDSILEVMKDNASREKFNIGGMVGNPKGGFAYDSESARNKVGALESLLAGIGAGLIDIPKGAFTLGAALMDVGFGTNNSAKMEAWFDDLTTFDEKAESHWLGSFARIATNLGVPGAYGFKAGSKLAEKALLAKRNGNYFKLTDPELVKKFDTSLNAKGRLLATLGGAAGVGATDAIFVGDPEGVGTFGDMIGGGPTELDPNNANLASKEIANRVRFGVDGALFLGLIGGTGSTIKSLARRRNELASNNDAIDKFFSVFRPRGKKSQEYFDMERKNIGARAGDINFAGEQARKLDKHIDAIFPFVKNPFNKLDNKGRAEFMDKLNDTLLSGEIRMDATGKVNFGAMDKNLSNEIIKIMKGKNAKQEDIDGVFDAFEQMRLGWGHIFSRLGYSMDDAGRAEFRALFGNKFKSYLGSTYEIFQNKSLLPWLRYKPTEEAVEKTIKLFMDSASEAGKPISRGEAELFVSRAIETVKLPRDIATSKEKTSGIYFDAPEFFANKTVLDEIELSRKTVAFDDLTKDSQKILGELFGKISDPMQTMLAGTNRLSMIGRRNEFFNDLVKADEVLIPKRDEFLKANPGKALPRELRGFFRETEAEAVEAFGGNIKKIEIDPSRTIEAGITNPVNGKYAERGVAEALEESSQIATAPSTLAQMYQSFILYPKATSQLAKTVLSPITHVRNFVSAGAFASANGLVPGIVSPEDFGKAMKEAFGQLQIPGARMDNERYRELLRLGVVNSNVRLGDLQRLLKDTNFGESVNTNKALRELMRPLSKAKKFTEDLYTAEDDFWKLTSFALERQRLGRAYEKYGIAKTAKELDEEAADIIRNNIPNYDMVNDFIKATRKLPLGNFVSFPAEIMRTTANILNRSLKEIRYEHTLSDGRVVKPLQGIGYKRLFGLGTTVVGVPYATTEAFKVLYDVTEDEMQALRRFVPDWSKNSTLVPIRGEDGKLKYIDFSHANAYDTIIRPINSMIVGVQRGMDEGELGKEVLKSMYEGTKETLSPFFSESIWTNALSDIVIRNGRTREGRRLYTDQTPWGERVNKSLLHLAETQFPGSIASFQRLDLAFEPIDVLKKGKFDEYGQSYNIPDEALGFLGLRAVEVNPVKAMKFKIADFRTGINNARREFTSPLLKGGPVSAQEIVDRYQVASNALYNVQEKMFRDYFAAMELGARVGQLDNEFADRVSNIQLNAIKRGEFKPFIPSENIEKAFGDNAAAIGQPNPFNQAKPFIQRLINLYDRTPFGVGLPKIENPFQQQSSLPITQSPVFQGIQITPGTTFGGLPQAGNQQALTAMKGQRVFGATDPIFGVG